MEKFATTDEYLLAQPDLQRNELKKILEIAKSVEPELVPIISYNMPALAWRPTSNLRNIVLYVAGFKSHVSMFPRTSAIDQQLADKMTAYATGKATLSFPLGAPLPEDLIRKFVEIRLAEIKSKIRARS